MFYLHGSGNSQAGEWFLVPEWKAVKVAADLLDWGTETSLSQEEIKSETVQWLSDKGNDEQGRKPGWTGGKRKQISVRFL